MGKKPAKKKTTRGGGSDVNEIAARILREATEGEESEDQPKRTPKRAAGGKARAKKLTPEQRSEIAKKAAKKRWEGD